MPEETTDRERAPGLDFWFDRWPFGLLIIVLVVSIAAPILTAVYYSPHDTWVSLGTGFSATVLAFLVALAWDRRQRSYVELQEAAAERRRDEAARAAEHERRETEAKRRFSAIALELERLQSSLRRTAEEAQRYTYFFPDLPSGSWQAASGPLGVIVSNYGLMADLSTFYGHVDELRWRLRFKAQPGVDEEAMSQIIEALAKQMLNDAAVLLAHVRRQIANPDLRGDAEADGGLVVARRQLTGAIRTVDVSALRGEGDAS